MIQPIHFNKAEVLSEYAFALKLLELEEKGLPYNLPNVMAAIRATFKEQLNYVCYPKDVYLDLDTWMQAVENYIVDAERNFDDADKAYAHHLKKDLNNAKK